MHTSPSQHAEASRKQIILTPPGTCPWPHERERRDDPTIDENDNLSAALSDSPVAPRQPSLRQQPDTLCLADLPKQDVDWLWPGRIPIGKVTLLVGDPGVGKSLVALDVAARVTRGAPWPDQSSRHTPCAETCPHDDLPIADNDAPNDPSFVIRHSETRHSPASVLLLSAEDDLADTVRPRLEAAGADCSRIIALPGAVWADLSESAYPQCGPISERGIAAPLHRSTAPRQRAGDFDQLDRVLDSRPDCRLVIIDPLSAYLGGVIDNLNSQVRRWIAPLAELAARRRLAVVAVHHLRKQQASALHRTMGSLAFVAAARTAWLVAADPADAERRLLLPVKNNLAALGGPLSFAIATAGADQQPVIEWSRDVMSVTADEALRPPKPPKQPVGRPSFERDDAIRWLQQALAEGAKPSGRIEEQAVAHGIHQRTIRRAFRELGGEAVRIGFGPLGQWYWRLPGIGEQNPQPTHDPFWPYEPFNPAGPATPK